MSRRAWFSAFGRPFFFPSVLSLAGLPRSKQSGAWLGIVCPPRATGNPAAHGTSRLGAVLPVVFPAIQEPGEAWSEPHSPR